eukprot:TRINITY_DN14664_c0_g1_i1.p1 TRINITY_DN14664_c0_g1~~TRINITY_DN14664_c0_g1_i1.p1  ORF type:complete len:262 (+),score=31.54 TRINITY_DN14664_c0_g1_i1:40-786(+)
MSVRRVWVCCGEQEDKCDVSACDDVADMRALIKGLFSTLSQIKPSDLVLTIRLADKKGTEVTRVLNPRESLEPLVAHITKDNPVVVTIHGAGASAGSAGAGAGVGTDPGTVWVVSDTGPSALGVRVPVPCNGDDLLKAAAIAFNVHPSCACLLLPSPPRSPPVGAAAQATTLWPLAEYASGAPPPPQLPRDALVLETSRQLPAQFFEALNKVRSDALGANRHALASECAVRIVVVPTLTGKLKELLYP